MTLKLRDATDGVRKLEELKKIEFDTKKKILTPEDERYLDEHTIQEYTSPNLIMTLGIDRFATYFGYCPGWFIDTPVDDRIGFQNIVQGYIQAQSPAPPPIPTSPWQPRGNPYTSGDYKELLYPEIIGIGSDRSARTVGMAGLVAPFGNGYRNTYNTIEGGHNRIANSVAPATGFDYDNNYIIKCVAFYDAGEINTLSDAIREVGLFLPREMTGSYVVDTSGIVYFSNEAGVTYPTTNKYWSILNAASMYLKNLGGGVFNFRFRTYDVAQFNLTRGSTNQTLGTNDTDIEAPPDNRMLITFTPRIDHVGVGTTWGTTANFVVEGLIASHALPLDFIKNVNNSLTVLWEIFVYRG